MGVRLGAALCALAAALPTLVLWAVTLGPVASEPHREELLSLVAGAGGICALIAAPALVAAASGAARRAARRGVAAAASLCMAASLLRLAIWDTERVNGSVLAFGTAAIILVVFSARREPVPPAGPADSALAERAAAGAAGQASAAARATANVTQHTGTDRSGG